MVQVEDGIARGGVRVEARVAGPRVVTACGGAVERLADGAEVFEIVAAGRELVLHVGGTGVGRQGGGDVAFETARVVAETVAVVIGIDGCRADADGKSSLFERTLFDAPASGGVGFGGGGGLMRLMRRQ